MSLDNELRWAKKVRPDLIRRLYRADAQGISDIELIDDVGYALLVRCESILTCTEAHSGRATCPRCKAKIAHNGDKLASLICSCGWETHWGTYLASYQHRGLVGGLALPAFVRFAEQWPRARTDRDKMLLIDALIHACHVDVRFGATRPAASNLIEGTPKELLAFLDELAYSDLSTPGVHGTKVAWRDEVTRGVLGHRNRGLLEPDGGEGG